MSTPSDFSVMSRSRPAVHILTPTFFDLDGNNMFYGGAERYLIELARLLDELGFETLIYQSGSANWVRYYQDVRVIGLDLQGKPAKLSEEYHRQAGPAALVIYSPFSLATKQAPQNSVGISHGVFWDLPSYKPRIPWLRHPFRDGNLLRSISRLAVLASVDTNTINWIRATDYSHASRCVYIPNFVDTAVFHPNPERRADPSRLVVVYPRRLYSPRGFGLVAQILPEFLEKHPQVDFHFVGKANPQETLQVQEFVRLYPGRVRWYFLPPEQMQTAYQEADIALIPTLHSEGTSLSCLEAMASGNVVIASHVGGLPDLVLDGFNGLLIDPQAESLREALEQVVNDAGLRERLRRNAVEVAQAFDIERWRSRWRRLLQDRLAGVTAGRPGGGAGKIIRTAVLPAAPGAAWLQAGERVQNLAQALASLGLDTYVYHTTRLAAPSRLAASGRLHILAAERDELILAHPALIITHPRQMEDINRYSDPFVVYDIPSQFEEPGGEPPADLAAHQRLLTRADLLLVSSQTLARKLEQAGAPFVFVPAGSNPADFVAALHSQKVFQESLNE